MSIYSTINITREDAIELVRKKVNDPAFLENIAGSWLDNILFSITDHDDNKTESRYFNYFIVDDYSGKRYYLDVDETITNMYTNNKHCF